jgi:hypothetical protein
VNAVNALLAAHFDNTHTLDIQIRQNHPSQLS